MSGLVSRPVARSARCPILILIQTSARARPALAARRRAVKAPPSQPSQGRTHLPPFKGGFEVDETGVVELRERERDVLFL